MFVDAGAVAPVAHIVLVTVALAVAASISDKDGNNVGNGCISDTFGWMIQYKVSSLH